MNSTRGVKDNSTTDISSYKVSTTYQQNRSYTAIVNNEGLAAQAPVTVVLPWRTAPVAAREHAVVNVLKIKILCS